MKNVSIIGTLCLQFKADKLCFVFWGRHTHWGFMLWCSMLIYGVVWYIGISVYEGHVASFFGIHEIYKQYEGCLESIQPFLISRETVAWPWCSLAASKRTPYCASVNSHSPVGLVSRQWDVIDWACVLYDRRIHKSPHFQRRSELWEKPEVAGS
jgi:hypothetical protein